MIYRFRSIVDGSYYKHIVFNIGQCFVELKFHTPQEVKEFLLDITVKELRMINNFYVLEIFNAEIAKIERSDINIESFFDVWKD